MASENVTIDLTSYRDRFGSRVEPGRYHVVVEDTEQDKSSNGNPMINVWLRVVGGDDADATLMDRLVLTDKSLFRVVGFMRAIGLPTPRKRLQVNIASWRGKHLFVDVEDGEPYNNRVRSEIRGYDVFKGSTAAPEREQSLDGLDEFAGAGTPDVTEGLLEEPGSGSDDGVTVEGQDEIDLDALNL